MDKNNKFISMKLNLAFNLKREKKYQEAENILTKLLEEYPDNPRIKRELADLMMKENRLENSLCLINDVLTSNPKDGEAMGIKGNIYYKEKRYPAAKEWLQGALREKDSIYSTQLLIKTMIRLNELDKALANTEKAIQKERENLYLLQLKAEILHLQDRTPEAIALYKYILEKKPGNKYIYKELIKLKTEKMDQKEASRELDALVKVSTYSKNEHLYTQQAESYKKQGNYKKAIEAYLKGLELAPDNLFIKKLIGFCCNKLQRYEEVIKFMKEPFLKEPKDYLVRSTLFSAYKKVDKREDLLKLIEEMGIAGTRDYYALMGEAKK
ncbi:MAG: tetratricopeptide repeat protein [bacterium]